MAGFIPAIHVFDNRNRAEATPFCERLCPDVTKEIHI
jgi:hypothetical protein